MLFVFFPDSSAYAPWSKSSSGELPQKDMALVPNGCQLKNSKNIRGMFFFCSPFTRGEVHGDSVCLPPRSYQQLLVGKRIVFASPRSQACAFLTSH